MEREELANLYILGTSTQQRGDGREAYINRKKPLRVLQIIGIVCGGGVESVIMNYYRHIDRNKVQFDFVIDGYEKSLLDDEIKSLGGKIYKVEPYRKNIFKYVYQIYKIIKNNHYQIVHSNMNTLSVFPLFAAWLASAKVRIVHNHSTAVKSEKLHSLLKCILKPFNTIFANKYVACSKLAGEWMFGRQLARKGTVKIIHNAIDLDKFTYNAKIRSKLRRDMGIKENTFVIGNVGRFMYQKNHDFLIDVFNEIHKKEKNSILVLIGDGPLRNEIEQKCKNLHIERNVLFLGIRHDVQDLYNIMDCFLLPSYYEGFPVVGVETQANGIPIFVSTNISSELEISDLVCFKKLSSGSLGWAKDILNLYKNTHLKRHNVKQNLIEAGYEINATAQDMMQMYETLIKE